MSSKQPDGQLQKQHKIKTPVRKDNKEDTFQIPTKETTEHLNNYHTLL